MPKLTSKTPKYRKHSSGQAFVELGGNRCYLGSYGTAVSKRECNRLVAEWLANGRQTAKAEEPARCTVKQLINEWIVWANKQVDCVG